VGHAADRHEPDEPSAASGHPVGGASAGTTYYTPSPEGTGTSGMLLNYLLGN